jgi:uncharacterized membrane protein
MPTSTQRVHACKIISDINYLLLIATLILFTFVGIRPDEAALWAMLAIKTLPLLVFIPGLIQGSDKTHAWLCFVILIYFTLGVLELFSTRNRLEGALITLFSTLLFISSTLYIRWHKST